MNRFLIYGFVSLLFLGGLIATLDRSQINAMRELVGLSPLYLSEAPAEDVEAAVEQVAVRRVPGVLDDPPTLGDVAGAAADCVPAERLQSDSVEAGLRRYVLALAAIGLAPDHPLVEPRFRPLHALVGQGPMAALQAAREGRLSRRERELLAEVHAAYRNPDHPLYRGLRLHGGTFDGLNFETAADAMAERWQSVAACAEERALPPLARWEPLAVE